MASPAPAFIAGVPGDDPTLEPAGRNPSYWSYLSDDTKDMILSKLSIQDLFRAKLISKWFNDHIGTDEFSSFRGHMRPQELSLTAINFFTGTDGFWQCAGYDLMSQSWKKLPPFSMLPSLDLKVHSICAAGKFMCVNISTSSSKDKMIAFNPLTRHCKKLPPLIHPRTPRLMQIVVDSRSESYKIIVAGNSRRDQKHLTKTTEVYDSTSGTWVVVEDMPGPLFPMNEHQTGVYKNGILYCIASLDGEDTKPGVLAFNVEEGKWVRHLSCLLPCPTNLNIVQLMPCSDVPAVFFEIKYGDVVEHHIQVLVNVLMCSNLRTNSNQTRGEWTNWVSNQTQTNRLSVVGNGSLQTSREYICFPFGEGKMCIFHTTSLMGLVYDEQTRNHPETLLPPTWSTQSGVMGFSSICPPIFNFEPSFIGEP